jgi:hypothetical protein
MSQTHFIITVIRNQWVGDKNYLSMKIATLWLVVRPSGLTPLEHGIAGSNISTFNCDNVYPSWKILLIMILKTFMVEARNGTRAVPQMKHDWTDGRELAAGYPVQAVIQLVEIGNIQLHQETKAILGCNARKKADEMMVHALRWSDKRMPWYHYVRHSAGSTQIDKPEHEVSDVGSAVVTSSCHYNDWFLIVSYTRKQRGGTQQESSKRNKNDR